MAEIDLIIPMVFPGDPVWLEEYGRHHSGDAQQKVRWRSWGTEELLVKCCMKYMPWLHRIYILLSGESQVQGWMKQIRHQPLPERRVEGADAADATTPLARREETEIRVVFHREFVPEKYLPCFASPCFEMFLHRIPGLSEQFIYANDDMFPLAPLEPGDFFRDGKPCQHITSRAYPANPNVFERKCMWQQNMIGRPFGLHFTKTYPDTGHIFSAILKSSCEEVWRRHGDEITRHLSPLGRNDRSANNWIYQLYQQYSGRFVDHRPPRHYADQTTPTARLAAIIRDRQAGIVCINDNEHICDWQQRAAVVRREISAKLGIENDVQKL